MSTLSTQVTKEYALTALMKLTTRFTTCADQIQLIINNYTTNTDVELQQRSVEYDAIFRKYEPLRQGLLERMPLYNADAVTSNETSAPTLINGDASSTEKAAINNIQVQQKNESDSLLDLLGDGLPVSNTAQPESHQNQNSLNSASSGLMDLLGDLDVGGTGSTPVSQSEYIQLEEVRKTSQGNWRGCSTRNIIFYLNFFTSSVLIWVRNCTPEVL